MTQTDYTQADLAAARERYAAAVEAQRNAARRAEELHAEAYRLVRDAASAVVAAAHSRDVTRRRLHETKSRQFAAESVRVRQLAGGAA